jgi:hypothetical protein
VLALSAISLLLFLMGCGSSGAPFPITGNYSNSTLSGNYTFSISGRQVVALNGTTEGPYREAGVFTADGNGNITSGTEDFNSAGVFGTISSTPITGKYSIGKDGNGVIQLNVGGGTETWAITVVSASKFYITEADAFSNFAANATGSGEQQSTSAFGAVPAGNFAFRVHENAGATPIAIVGQLSLAANGNASGSADLIQGNIGSAGNISGTFSAPDSTGRGTASVNIAGFADSFIYYVINANTISLFEADSNVVGLGRAELQSGGPFSGSSLTGSYVFATVGDTSANFSAINSVGTFAVTGATLSGTFDSVQNGNVTVSQSYTGGITGPNSAGRVAVTDTAGPITIQEIWYLVSPGRAFVLRYYPATPGTVEDGVIDQQTGGPFNNGSLKGQYAFLMGVSTNIGTNLLSRVGTFIPDGNGNLNLNETTNLYTGAFAGSIVTSPIYIKGATYTSASNGRFTASAPSLSNNLVIYMVSPTKAWIMQGDSGVQEIGPVELQQ